MWDSLRSYFRRTAEAKAGKASKDARQIAGAFNRVVGTLARPDAHMRQSTLRTQLDLLPHVLGRSNLKPGAQVELFRGQVESQLKDLSSSELLGVRQSLDKAEHLGRNGALQQARKRPLSARELLRNEAYVNALRAEVDKAIQSRPALQSDNAQYSARREAQSICRQGGKDAIGAFARRDLPAAMLALQALSGKVETLKQLDVNKLEPKQRTENARLEIEEAILDDAFAPAGLSGAERASLKALFDGQLIADLNSALNAIGQKLVDAGILAQEGAEPHELTALGVQLRSVEQMIGRCAAASGWADAQLEDVHPDGAPRPARQNAAAAPPDNKRLQPAYAAIKKAFEVEVTHTGRTLRLVPKFADIHDDQATGVLRVKGQLI